MSYRQLHTFTSQIKDWGMAVAELAALVLQNILLHDRILKQERAYMHREIHNRLIQHASMASLLLERMTDTYQQKHEINEDQLHLAFDCSRSLVKQTRYLIELWRDPEHNYHLFEEIKRYADIVQKTLEVTCRYRSEGTDKTVPSTLQKWLSLTCIFMTQEKMPA